MLGSVPPVIGPLSEPTPQDLERVCGVPASTLCEWTYTTTGNAFLAGTVRFLLGTPLQLLLVALSAVLLGAVVRRLVRRSVDRLNSSEIAAGRVGLRAETLGTVVSSTAVALIWFIAVLTAISTLGIQISGFIAGASIVGGALAFGAQQLVRDFLTGFFVLSEDQYGVGDVVDLGHAVGTVEKVSLRTTRLRDVEGRVWHVPHGQVVRAGNLSQEWARSLLDVPVARWADVEEVTATLDRIARRLTSDPAVGPLIIDEPQVMGVEQVADDRFVVRVLVKTKPGDQFTVSRAWRAEILKARQDGSVPFPEPVPNVLVKDTPPRAGDTGAGAPPAPPPGGSGDPTEG